MPPYDIRRMIRLYQRQYGLQGTVNTDNLELSYGNVLWGPLKYVDDKTYPMFRKRGYSFNTEIGTEVTITSGRLQGLYRDLSLSLDDLPWYITRNLPSDSIKLDLGERETTDTEVYTFTAGEAQLSRNRWATFQCNVKLEGFVIFKSKYGSDEVDISEIARENRFWTVEGECIFHLGLNESIEWL